MVSLGDEGAHRRSTQKMRWAYQGHCPFRGAFSKDWESEKCIKHPNCSAGILALFYR